MERILRFMNLQTGRAATCVSAGRRARVVLHIEFIIESGVQRCEKLKPFREKSLESHVTLSQTLYVAHLMLDGPTEPQI